MKCKRSKNDNAFIPTNSAQSFLEKEVQEIVGKSPSPKTRVYIALSSTVARRILIWKEPYYSSISPSPLLIPNTIAMSDFFDAMEKRGFNFVAGCYVLKYN